VPWRESAAEATLSALLATATPTDVLHVATGFEGDALGAGDQQTVERIVADLGERWVVETVFELADRAEIRGGTPADWLGGQPATEGPSPRQPSGDAGVLPVGAASTTDYDELFDQAHRFVEDIRADPGSVRWVERRAEAVRDTVEEPWSGCYDYAQATAGLALLLTHVDAMDPVPRDRNRLLEAIRTSFRQTQLAAEVDDCLTDEWSTALFRAYSTAVDAVGEGVGEGLAAIDNLLLVAGDAFEDSVARNGSPSGGGGRG
jgi:hypothetical protein